MLPPALGPAKAQGRAEAAETTLSRALGEPVSVHVAKSYGELEREIATGKVDLAWVPAAACVHLPPVRGIFTVVRQGQTTYRSALVARKDVPLTLATLRGTHAAWVDPLSTGGYLLAMARLRQEGIDPDRCFASQAFFGSHRLAVEAVLHGNADVTAVSTRATDPEGLATVFRWYAGPAGDRLSAIAITDECLNDAFVITAEVPEAASRQIVEKLSLEGDGARAKILAVFEADGMVKTQLEEYRKLGPRLGLGAYTPRKSQMPPR